MGVDEVGRGPLAGPVVACAAYLPDSIREAFADLRDSKALSPKRREALFQRLRESDAVLAFGWVHPRGIDRSDIRKATLQAMRLAVARLRLPGKTLTLVDGRDPIPGLSTWQKPLVGGDRNSQAVAAASVAAKVLRDRWMVRLEARHPGYGFSGNKGYGSAAHMTALRDIGPCEAHRFSFAPLKGNVSREEREATASKRSLAESTSARN